MEKDRFEVKVRFFFFFLFLFLLGRVATLAVDGRLRDGEGEAPGDG